MAERPSISLRISPEARAAVEKQAAIEDRTFSDMLRLCLTDGLAVRQRKVRG